MVISLYNHNKFAQRRRDLRKNSTDVEIILWNIIRNKKLGYKFRRQYSIGPYIVDFYCVEKRLVIELDGSQHYTDSGIDYDTERDNYLKSLDCVILRFSNRDVIESIDGIVIKIQDYLK
jgi:very-short-patch-repair endonuclease